MAEIVTRRPLLASEPEPVAQPLEVLEITLLACVGLCLLLVLYFTVRIRHYAVLHVKQKKQT